MIILSSGLDSHYHRVRKRPTRVNVCFQMLKTCGMEYALITCLVFNKLQYIRKVLSSALSSQNCVVVSAPSEKVRQ